MSVSIVAMVSPGFGASDWTSDAGAGVGVTVVWISAVAVFGVISLVKGVEGVAITDVEVLAVVGVLAVSQPASASVERAMMARVWVVFFISVSV